MMVSTSMSNQKGGDGGKGFGKGKGQGDWGKGDGGKKGKHQKGQGFKGVDHNDCTNGLNSNQFNGPGARGEDYFEGCRLENQFFQLYGIDNEARDYFYSRIIHQDRVQILENFAPTEKIISSINAGIGSMTKVFIKYMQSYKQKMKDGAELSTGQRQFSVTQFSNEYLN